MSFSLVQKEDFRLRMADLEKKLAESEEERCRLEKTCNVLMRAFREEEKMQYKALNKKYEKFLEDCTVRKRRNDIILRSLCRIEDRSKALFAKTERLKLLKDRYISYLKINCVKTEDVCFHSSRSFPFITQSQNIRSDVISAVKRTTGRETPKMMEFEEGGRHSFSRIRSPTMICRDNRDTSVEVLERDKPKVHEGRNSSESEMFNGILNEYGRTQDTVSSVDTGFDFQGARTILKSFLPENEKSTASQIGSIPRKFEEPESKSYTGNTSSKNKKVVSYDDSVKIKKVLSFGKNPENSEKAEEENLHRKISEDVLPPKSYNFIISNNTTGGERKEENEVKTPPDPQGENISSDPSVKNSLPKGLDGVDYQDETYPESYYEQPVHHNHTSIASDVILEEDETEPDFDDGMKRFDSEYSPREAEPNSFEKEITARSGGSRVLDEPQQKCEENEIHLSKTVDINGKDLGKVKSQDSDSEISVEIKQSEDKSEESEKLAIEKSDKSKIMGKSNLSHLLESDSESFQIEHGDVMSGNEDSDFDFSFHQK